MTNPSYLDGAQSLAALTASCLNNGKTYICFGFDPKTDATVKKFTDQSGQPIGSDTRVGFKEGTLKMQLEQASDALPLVGFIYNFRDSFYIGGAVAETNESHEVVKFDVTALKAINPIIAALLSSVGQILVATALTSGGTYTLNCKTGVLNVRAGATQLWSLESGAPLNMAIDPSTGIITYTTPVAGTYNVVVKVKDSVAGEPDRFGLGYLKLTLT